MAGITGNWQVGWDKSVQIGSSVLKILESSWDEEIEKLIVTHSQSGGVEGWIPGILKGEGTVRANVDADLVPSSSLGITPGAFGTMRYTIGSANPFVIPIGVVKVHYQSAVEGKVEYSFTVALNSEASDGIYTRAS
jgi:hypothetical protein